MLSLDHVENNGAAHRRSMKAGSIYSWIVRHLYPDGFQTLCFNHQMKKELRRRRTLTDLEKDSIFFSIAKAIVNESFPIGATNEERKFRRLRRQRCRIDLHTDRHGGM
jgi:hypothetical protein